MPKTILIIFVILFQVLPSASALNSDTIQHNISFQYGIDLTDTFTGFNKNFKKTQYPSFISVTHSIIKSWYGANTYVGLYTNKNYLVPRSDYSYTFFVPENTIGFLTGINGVLVPISGKIFMLQLESGFQYSLIKHEYCYTWSYSVSNQIATLNWVKYQTKTFKGFSFAFGIKTSVKAYRNFSLMFFGRATSALTESNISMFLTGAGIEYKF